MWAEVLREQDFCFFIPFLYVSVNYFDLKTSYLWSITMR